MDNIIFNDYNKMQVGSKVPLIFMCAVAQGKELNVGVFPRSKVVKYGQSSLYILSELYIISVLITVPSSFVVLVRVLVKGVANDFCETNSSQFN